MSRNVYIKNAALEVVHEWHPETDEAYAIQIYQSSNMVELHNRDFSGDLWTLEYEKVEE